MNFDQNNPEGGVSYTDRRNYGSLRNGFIRELTSLAVSQTANVNATLHGHLFPTENVNCYLKKQHGYVTTSKQDVSMTFLSPLPTKP